MFKYISCLTTLLITMNNKHIAFLCISFCLTNLYGYSQSKQVADFKAIKKSIDTLFFLTPHVFIESTSKSASKPDTVLTASVSKQLTQKIYSTLKNKYQVQNSFIRLDSNSYKDINNFFNHLDNLDKILPDIAIPQWLVLTDGPDKYAIAVFFYGHYLADFEPYYLVKKSMESNKLLLNPPPLYNSSIKLLVIDKLKKKILYYNTISSKRLDPRIPAEVEQLASSIIRPIYYK